jgi:hypothetical protein
VLRLRNAVDRRLLGGAAVAEAGGGDAFMVDLDGNDPEEAFVSSGHRWLVSDKEFKALSERGRCVVWLVRDGGGAERREK